MARQKKAATFIRKVVQFRVKDQSGSESKAGSKGFLVVYDKPSPGAPGRRAAAYSLIHSHKGHKR